MRTLKVHLPAALVSGLIVFAVLNVAAWHNLRGATNVCRRQDQTRRRLRFVADELAAFQKEHGELPARLVDLPEEAVFSDHPDSLLFDEWGNPIQYSVSNGGFTLCSFGRDGKQGGVGLDAELYHDDRNREASLATFHQFFTEPDSAEVDAGNFIFVGFLAGGIVAFAVFSSLRAQERMGQRPPGAGLLLGVAVVVLLACVVGVLLLPLHIPSGH